MRLRDRPKTLADMKSDVAWSAALQAVMDRGLARAPAERYPTAPEFAEALAAAAADPSAGPAPAKARAVSTPTRVASAAAPQQRAAPDRNRARRAMVGSAVVFAAVALAGVAFLANRRAANGASGSERAAADSALVTPTRTVGVDSVPPVNTRSPGAPALGASDGRKLGAQPMPANPGSSVATAPRTDTTTPPNIGSAARPSPTASPARASLDHVESLIARARSDTTRAAAFAREVLDSARAIVPRLEAREDIVEIGVYTVAAYLLLGRKGDACLVLESIGAEAAEMKKFATQVQLWNDRLECRG